LEGQDCGGEEDDYCHRQGEGKNDESMRLHVCLGMGTSKADPSTSTAACISCDKHISGVHLPKLARSSGNRGQKTQHDAQHMEPAAKQTVAFELGAMEGILHYSSPQPLREDVWNSAEQDNAAACIQNLAGAAASQKTHAQSKHRVCAPWQETGAHFRYVYSVLARLMHTENATSKSTLVKPRHQKAGTISY